MAAKAGCAACGGQRVPERRWSPGLGVSLCVVPLLCALLALGAWQLSRGEEKARLYELQLDRLSAFPVVPTPPLEDADFMRVKLQGSFVPGEHYLVDNQTVNGRPGYWVVQPFESAGRRWLVNRGWLAAGRRRDELPAVPEQAGRVEIVAVSWPDLGLLPSFDDAPWSDEWPKRIAVLDVPRLAADASAEPWQLRLETGQPGRLGPLATSLGWDAPRHRGYAVQWFGLALVLVAGYVLHGYTERDR